MPSPQAAAAALLLLGLLAPYARASPAYEPLVRAHVVVAKSLVAPGGVVQGKPFTVLYSIRNVGSDEALDVAVSDDFPALSFTLVESSAGGGAAPEARFAKLAPGQNETARLVLVPKVAGVMNMARANVEYKYLKVIDEGVPETVEVAGLSTTPGRVEISRPEYHARVQAVTSASSHALSWGAMFLLGLGAVIGPWHYYNEARAATAKCT